MTRCVKCAIPLTDSSPWVDQFGHAPQEHHPQPIHPHHACNCNFCYSTSPPEFSNEALQNAERASVRLAARFTAPIAGQPMFEVGALMHGPPTMFSAMLYQHPPPPPPQVQKRPSSEVEEPPSQKSKKSKKSKSTDGNGASCSSLSGYLFLTLLKHPPNVVIMPGKEAKRRRLPLKMVGFPSFRSVSVFIPMQRNLCPLSRILQRLLIREKKRRAKVGLSHGTPYRLT